jgi:signal peptidase
MMTYLGVRPGQAVCIIIALLAGIYLVINLALPRLPIETFIETYALQPILWLLLAGAVLVLPRYRPAAKLKDKAAIIQLAFIIGFFQVLVYIVGGLFSSFGKSPYTFTPLGILTNLFFVGSMLVGMELSRAWLINHVGKKHTFPALAFIALLYTLLSIPLAQVTGIRAEVESISFINSSLLPSVAENLLASFLALLAGPVAAIAYRGMLQAFWWFCPILPDLPWAFKGLIGTALPIVGLVVVNSLYSPQPRHKKAGQAKEGSLAGWIVTTVVAVAIIWFAVGLFPIQPTLVASGSMRPTMDVGDVVIIVKVPADVVNQGDIIQFRKAKSITVMHRVVEIQETEGAKLFITKGDATGEPDTDPVIPENVIGKAVFNIPKIGWMAIGVKSFFTG